MRTAKMRTNKAVSYVFAAALIGGFVGFAPANAGLINVSHSVSGGLSKDNQTSASDLSSILGASLDVNFNFTNSSDTVGVWTIDITNTGAGVMTAFGMNLDNGFNFSGSGFTFTPTGTPPCTQPTGSGDQGCAFSNASNSSFSGFLAQIDIAATANPSPSKRGLEVGQSGTFAWNVTGNFASFDANTSFFDLVTASTVEGNFADFDAFWVAHVQVLAGGESDKIGGAVNGNGTTVPEPGSIALLGAGLIGLGVLARRRRKTA